MNSAVRVSTGWLPGLLLLLLTAAMIPLPTTAQCPALDPTRCGCKDNGVSGGNKPNRIINLWPGGIIFYTISTEFAPSYQSMIRNVLQTLENRVGKNHIEMREAVTKSGKICRKNRIKFMRVMENKCAAMIGMQMEAPTEVHLNETYCNQEYAVMHELLHAIGRIHEHERVNRNDHLLIDYNNLYEPYCSGFKLPTISDSQVATALPYDYESIMHYESCAGSCNGGYVMTEMDGKPIGVNRNLTKLDVLNMHQMYPAEHKVENSPSLCRDGDQPEQPVTTRVIPRGNNDKKGCTGDTECSGSWARPWRPRELAAVAMGTVLLHLYY